jgi:hypothetical protein
MRSRRASSATISQLSHRLAGRHRTRADGLDLRRTLTCGYGLRRTRWTSGTDLRSEGWGFESLRARPGQRPLPIMEGAHLLTRLLAGRPVTWLRDEEALWAVR